MSDVVSEYVGPAPTEAAPEAPVEAPQGAVDEANTQPPSPQEEDFSSRFAALARKEKYLREQEEAIKANSDKYKGYDELEGKVKENPLAVLERFGLDLDTIIAASLGEEAPPMSVEDQIKALRDEIAANKEAETRKEQEAREAAEKAYQDSIDEAILAHKGQIADHLGQNKEKYELINLQGAEDLVWEVTEAHFEANDGEVLSPEQAADKVEAYLEEQVRKALQLSRFKAKQEAEKAQAPWETVEESPVKRQESPTLSQDLVAPAAEKPTAHLSDEESKALAAKLLNWN